MDYVEFSFHCLFEVVQYPARCCMLLQQILIYCCKTPLAPPLAARAAVYHVLPPPVGGRTFIKLLFPKWYIFAFVISFISFRSFVLAESPRIDYLGFEELLDVGEIVVPSVCLGGSCGVWGAS